MSLPKILLFASGQGSNAAAIIYHLRQRGTAEIAAIVCNKSGAGVLDIAANFGIPTLLISREDLAAEDFPRRVRDSYAPDLIVLAGFLLKIPAAFVAAFPDRIINLHPALLPKHGGAGMWGRHVHNAVLAAGELESGITIHRVNEHYDEGDILLQARCPVEPGDSAETLAARIRRLEHFYLPRCVEFLVEEIGAKS
jgi:phosphoribosylglycinamide formyltransferase-1